MDTILKVTGTLADATRYSIYEYILKEHDKVTVQDVANEFGIHPNVARLHLTKLEDVQLICSHLNKTGKGGRPGKVYRPAEEAVQLSFPHRDYQLLANILVETVQMFGEDGLKMAEVAAVKAGRRAVESRAKNYVSSLTEDEKLSMLQSLATRIGYVLEAEPKEDGWHVQFIIYNCPFKGMLHDEAEITCKIHTAFLKGTLEALFDDVELHQKTTMLEGCQDCTYHAIVTN
ncbi:helix-turn-helix transcriptional regulator [Domibacillus mangrovi]|uniref:Transcriptional regulator n=1 Tax=Domibacillus mangrovi TaxID=1714354 RepID=A0A1Q5P7B9_9BACI|nr:helix-turn-helix domain-containing protein [Domibacillus mangrovi]OKL38104.1 hypothetical protein BLL40_01380 [Domibacillus mangrovi]